MATQSLKIDGKRLNLGEFAAAIGCSEQHAQRLATHALVHGEGWARKSGKLWVIDFDEFSRKMGGKSPMKQKNPLRRSGKKKGTIANGTARPATDGQAKVATSTLALAALRGAIDSVSDEGGKLDATDVEFVQRHIINAEAALAVIGEEMKRSPAEFASTFRDVSMELRQLRSHLRDLLAANATTVPREQHEQIVNSIANVTKHYIEQLSRTLPSKVVADVGNAGVEIEAENVKRVMAVVQQRVDGEFKSMLVRMADEIASAQSRMQEAG